MAAEVLVMCPVCGRPQRGGPFRCVACASVLPSVPLPISAANALPASVEAALGHRCLVVRGDRLECRVGGRVHRFQLGVGGVREVRLEQRPFFEALAVGLSLALLLAVLPSLAARLALLPVILVSLAACFLKRRYRLTVLLDGGRRAGLPLGTCRVDQVGDLRRRLGSLAQTLEAYGVTVGQTEAHA